MGKLTVLISTLLITAVYAVSATSVSLVLGPRAGLIAGKDIMLPGGWSGYFDMGAKCDIVFEMSPIKGFLAVTPTFDYLLSIEYPRVITAGLSAKVRYPHHRFVPYAYFGGLFYSEGAETGAAGVFRSAFGEEQLGVITTMGGGCDIRIGSRFGVYAEFNTLDLGTFIGLLGGASLFL